MKTLLLLRHAKSSWKDTSLADHDRPLNKRGKRNAPRMGRLLVEKNLMPDLILTSSAKRARKTAMKAARAADYRGEIVRDKSLYHAEPEELLRVLARVGGEGERVLMVGHNPGLEDLLHMLCDEDEEMPTGALAQLEADIGDWKELTKAPELHLQGRAPLMQLKGLWKPRELPDDEKLPSSRLDEGA